MNRVNDIKAAVLILEQATSLLSVEEMLAEILLAQNAPETVHMMQAYRINALKALATSIEARLNMLPIEMVLPTDEPSPEPELPADS